MSRESTATISSPMSEAQPTPAPIVPKVPCVYREDGYLLLTLSTRVGEVHYYSTREGGRSHSLRFPDFMARMREPEPFCNPYRMMLSILAQEQSGVLRVRARDKRKILSMLEKDQDELLKLDETQLGKEYARIVGKAPPEDKPKDQLVKELLMKIGENVASQEQKENKGQPAPEGQQPAAEAAPTATPAPAAPAQGEAVSKKTTKKPAAPAKTAKKPAGKKDATKKDKKPDKKKVAPPPKETKAKKKGDGPFREGSMKAKAYEFFKQCGGDREKVIAHTVKLGSTESTAKSWYAVFCKV